MPAKKQAKVLVSCPRCGHQQSEPRAAISTACKKCGQYIRVKEVLKPAARSAGRPKELRKLVCFECGTELEVAVSAQSTMCKRCSSHIDLRDYHISNAVSKNFKTKGELVLEPKGYVFNTEAVVGDAIIKGKFLGKLVAERSLTIYSTADIKGHFKAGRLVIPAENHFRWKEEITVGAAEIAGLAEVRLGERECPGLVVAEPEPPELVDPPEDDVPIVVGELDHPDCGCT